MKKNLIMLGIVLVSIPGLRFAQSLINEAHADEIHCLARPGVYLCIGDGALTGDPGRDRCIIARLRVAKATVDVERLTAPIEVAQPSPEPRQLVVDRLNEARMRLVKDCSPDTAAAVK